MFNTIRVYSFLTLISLTLSISFNSYSSDHETDNKNFIKTRKQYIDVLNVLKDLAIKHSNDVELFELGVADDGEVIYGLRIGQGKTHHLVVAGHHGNEYGSVEVAQAFAQDLSKNPIKDQTIHVIPVLNINGYNRRARREKALGFSRDPNRDYPGPCGTAGPWNLMSTLSLADYINRYPIISSATLHTFTPAVLYPWGLSTRDVETEYTQTFVEMSKAATFVSNYQVGNSTLLLYPADGTFEDYAFWKHGIWSLLFEMGTSHRPNEDSVAQMIEDNVPGLRNMFVNAPKERASNHDFTGNCSNKGLMLDLGIE